MPKVDRTYPKPGQYHYQTIIFPKDKWSKEESEQWLKDHESYTDGYHETDDYHRWRQFDPEDDRFNYFYKTIAEDGVKANVGVPKEEKDRDKLDKQRCALRKRMKLPEQEPKQKAE